MILTHTAVLQTTIHVVFILFHEFGVKWYTFRFLQLYFVCTILLNHKRYVSVHVIYFVLTSLFLPLLDWITPHFSLNLIKHWMKKKLFGNGIHVVYMWQAMTILTGTSTTICVRACDHASVDSLHVGTKCFNKKTSIYSDNFNYKKNQINATRLDVCQYIRFIVFSDHLM